MSKIKAINYFTCGSCQNQATLIFKRTPRQTLVFQAGVFLLEHEELGYILYDTGYDADIMRNRLKYWAFRLPNPIKMSKKLQIDQQLADAGISPDEIKLVVISHLHPDHIGRLQAFKKATFYMTRECYQTYLRPRFRDLVFKEYFPEDFDQRLKIVDGDQVFALLEQKACDLLGDGSLIAYSLDGHARGQLCLWLPDVQLFIGADTIWDLDMMDQISQMRLLPRLIQNNFRAYQKSVEILKAIQNQGVRLLVCHDKPERIRRYIDEAETNLS